MTEPKTKNNSKEKQKEEKPLYSTQIDEFLSNMATFLGILHGGSLVAGVNPLNALLQVVLFSIALFVFERWVSKLKKVDLFQKWVGKIMRPIQIYLRYIILHIIGKMFFVDSNYVSVMVISRPIVIFAVLATISVALEEKVGK
jgi:hypothetical protein